MQFNFTVRGDRIEPKKDYSFIEGNRDVYNAIFDFDEHWDGYAKLCILEIDGKSFKPRVIIDGKCILPEFSKGTVKIGVVGVVDSENPDSSPKISTNMCDIFIGTGAASAESLEKLNETAAEVWEQYIAIIETKRVEAEKAALNALKSAENAQLSAKEAEEYKNFAEKAADDSENAAIEADAAAERSETAAENSENAAKKAEMAEANAENILDRIREGETLVQDCEESAVLAAADAKNSAEKAAKAADSIKNLKATATEGADVSVTQTMTEDGIWLDFTLPRGEKGDKGEKGEQGPQGIRGEQGPEGIKGKDGADGADGRDGADGYTPQKGVDYWTEDDITEMKNDVSTEIEAELNTALQEIIAIQEELMTPDGNGVEY